MFDERGKQKSQWPVSRGMCMHFNDGHSGGINAYIVLSIYDSKNRLFISGEGHLSDWHEVETKTTVLHPPFDYSV